MRRIDVLFALLWLSSCEPDPVDLGMLTKGTCRDDGDCTQRPTIACKNSVCVEPTCPSGTLYVSGGTFKRGCDMTDTDCDIDAQPSHQVTLTSGFCFAVNELTVANYRACLGAGKCAAPAAPETLSSLRCSTDLATWTDTPADNETLPMSCLLYGEAAAVCAAAGGHLPTEAEWERAARGNDGRAFPWGRSTPISCDQGVNFSGSECPMRPWPATADSRTGAMLSTPFGLLDLGGNISEWVADFYAENAYLSCENGCKDPQGPPSGQLRVRRGGSFGSLPPELRSYGREFHLPEGPRSDLIGVRCAFIAQ